MDRESEFSAFKRLNLSLIASAFGYEVVRKKSTRHSVVMDNGADKIVVSRSGDHYVYFSVHDPKSAGTVIDLVQRSIEPGCSLGRVRQVLRPFLDGGHVALTHRQQQGRFQDAVHPSRPDLPGVAARYARFKPIEKPHAYLCQTRGVPFGLLQSPSLRGRVLHCPKRQSVIFPHWSSVEAADQQSGEVCGYEIKGRGVNLFSKGGQKGLWLSAPSDEDRILAIAESGLDAVSYLAVRGEEGARVASISGQMNRHQPELLKQAIKSLPPGSQVVAAFDNDPGGDLLTQKLEAIVKEAGRSDVTRRDDRPAKRGSDWNQIAMEKSKGESLRHAFARPGMSP